VWPGAPSEGGAAASLWCLISLLARLLVLLLRGIHCEGKRCRVTEASACIVCAGSSGRFEIKEGLLDMGRGRGGGYSLLLDDDQVTKHLLRGKLHAVMPSVLGHSRFAIFANGCSRRVLGLCPASLNTLGIACARTAGLMKG
jgi:hypothetical protein